MAKKRITRKKLLKEPDEFINFTGKAIRFVQQYQNQIIGLVCGLFVILLFMTGLNYYFKSADKKAFALLDKGIDQYLLVSKNQDAKKAYEDVKENFDEIIDKYSARNGGKIAKVVYADICYEAGNYEKAASLYKQAIEDFSDQLIIKGMILSSLGHTYEQAGDHTMAAGYFKKVIDEDISGIKDEALFNLGGIYFNTGEKTKGVEYFKKIITDHMDSIYSDLVREKI